MQRIHVVIDDLKGLPDKELTPMGVVPEELPSGEYGSLIDLADRFTEAGPGSTMAFWNPRGSIPPIIRHLVRHVLGEARVEELAILIGIPSERFLQRPGRLVPTAVHRMVQGGGAKVLYAHRVRRYT
jgi:uncharacterized protein YidB (DUF937 family)